jgi:hypothetical protein
MPHIEGCATGEVVPEHELRAARRLVNLFIRMQIFGDPMPQLVDADKGIYVLIRKDGSKIQFVSKHK